MQGSSDGKGNGAAREGFALSRLTIEIADDAGAAVSAHLAQWLADGGFSNDAEELREATTLSVAELGAVVVSSLGAVTALITALARFARARQSTLVVTAPDGATLTIIGPVSSDAVSDFVSHLALGDGTEET
jgi:hypothetical protein